MQERNEKMSEQLKTKDGFYCDEPKGFTYVEYPFFVKWVMGLLLTPMDKRAILQQIEIREEKIKEIQDKLSRRNMQIKELKKRVKELEAYNMTFGDKRDYQLCPECLKREVHQVLNVKCSNCGYTE